MSEPSEMFVRASLCVCVYERVWCTHRWEDGFREIISSESKASVRSTDINDDATSLICRGKNRWGEKLGATGASVRKAGELIAFGRAEHKKKRG